MTAANYSPRAAALRKARRLEYFTLAWNSLEALASLVAGILAGSIALVGFGLDSVIETGSAVALLWRFRQANEASDARRESAELAALRVVGALFLALAVYIAAQAAWMLWRHGAAERSVAGVIVASLSVVVMPLLGRAKRKTAAALASKALNADSRQSDFCAYLAAITLCGVALNYRFGWWWADPAAALATTPMIAREGILSLRGESCGCSPLASQVSCGESSACDQVATPTAAIRPSEIRAAEKGAGSGLPTTRE